jgi:hypothetical protein
MHNMQRLDPILPHRGSQFFRGPRGSSLCESRYQPRRYPRATRHRIGGPESGDTNASRAYQLIAIKNRHMSSHSPRSGSHQWLLTWQRALSLWGRSRSLLSGDGKRASGQLRVTGRYRPSRTGREDQRHCVVAAWDLLLRDRRSPVLCPISGYTARHIRAVPRYRTQLCHP